MVLLGNCSQRRCAAVTRALFGCLMKGRNMVGEPGHQGRIQSVGLGELVEQRRPIEAPHHYDPVDRRTLAPKPHSTIRVTGQRSYREITLGRRAAVKSELAFEGGPALFSCRKVEIRKFYR